MQIAALEDPFERALPTRRSHHGDEI